MTSGASLASQDQVLNTANMYVTTGRCTQAQVTEAFDTVFRAMREAKVTSVQDSKFLYEVNVLIKRDEKGDFYYGNAYAWVNDPSAFNLLLGLNADGTARVKKFPDPNWCPPVVAPTSKLGANASWADIGEEEDELTKAVTAPMIEEKLPPLFVLPKVHLTREQVIEQTRSLRMTEINQHTANTVNPTVPIPARKQAKEQEKLLTALLDAEIAAINGEFDLKAGKNKSAALAAMAAFDGLKGQYPRYLDLNVDREYELHVARSVVNLSKIRERAHDDGKEVLTYQLTCRNAPSWVTADVIQPYFAKFSSDTNIYTDTVNKKKVQFSYPRIRASPLKGDSRDGSRTMLIITFSQNQAYRGDAAFALQMRTQTIVTDPASGKSARLIFSYWFENAKSVSEKTDRPTSAAQSRPTSARSHHAVQHGALPLPRGQNAWAKPLKS